MDDSARRDALFAGVKAIFPILLGVVPFGVIAGVAAVEAGLDPVQAIAMSPIVFAGAAQLAAADLIARDAAPLVIVLTALVINARFAMYSASLAPSLRGLGAWQKALGSYLLTDQAFAVSVTRFQQTDDDLGGRVAYYFGSAISLWITWQVSSVLGVIVGSGVPPEWSLDFAIPLVFMALLFPTIRDRGTRLAAVVAALSAVALIGLPLNLGLLAAAALGISAGVISEVIP
ncbi:MAG: AzlC family ABC transporter permease [Actinomycetota bacterium]|nr:AzlC family ABC transporter permease [Actinomycetota bacterium]